MRELYFLIREFIIREFIKNIKGRKLLIVCDLFLYCCMSINCYTKYFFTKEKRHKVQ